jgi:hypothetical protein
VANCFFVEFETQVKTRLNAFTVAAVECVCELTYYSVLLASAKVIAFCWSLEFLTPSVIHGEGRELMVYTGL